jgi:Tol biopolymer transport system component
MRLLRLLFILCFSCWLGACAFVGVETSVPDAPTDEDVVVIPSVNTEVPVVNSTATGVETSDIITQALMVPPPQLTPWPTSTPDPIDITPQPHPLGMLIPVVLNANGEPPNDEVYNAAISDDGRFIAFQSRADNLVPDDTNESDDIFLLDRNSGEIRLLSVADDGARAEYDLLLSGMSDDGRYVIFESFMGNPFPQSFDGRGGIYLHDTVMGRTEIVSPLGQGNPANGSTYLAEISSNGRYIVFLSTADNLVPGDTNTVCTNRFTGATGLNCEDIYLYDRENGTTERISVLPDGTQGNDRAEQAKISNDGRWVAFTTSASNFLPTDPNDGACYYPPTDSQVNCPDLFLRDRETGAVTLISKANDGTPGNMGASLTDISADGRFITYDSESDNLVPGDTNGLRDVFLYDREADSTVRLSVAPDGTEGDGTSWGGSLSPDGRYVVFDSHANTLVDGDSNTDCPSSLYGTLDRNCADGFLLDRESNQITRLTLHPGVRQARSNLYVGDFTPDLHYFLLTGGWSLSQRSGLYLLERQ